MKEQNELSDEVLIERYCKEGSQQAMALLCKRYWDEVNHFIEWKYYIAPEDSKDLTQEIFLLLSFKLEGHYAEQGHFRSWFFRVINNYMIDYVRKNRRALISTDYDMDSLQACSAEDETEKAKEFEHASALAGMLLDSLPSDKKSLIELKFKEQKTFQEIADMLGIKKSTCVKRIRVICQQMREKMIQKGIDEVPGLE